MRGITRPTKAKIANPSTQEEEEVAKTDPVSPTFQKVQTETSAERNSSALVVGNESPGDRPNVQLFTGMKEDVAARIPLYCDDWKRPKNLFTTEGSLAVYEALLIGRIIGEVYALLRGHFLLVKSDKPAVKSGQPHTPHYRMRTVFAVYNMAIAIIVMSVLSFLPGVAQDTDLLHGIKRVETRCIPWDWRPTTETGTEARPWVTYPLDGIEVKGIFGALFPAFMLYLLFFIDHSILTQAPTYKLRKPPANHWDSFVLGLTIIH
ncbi:unnamed protein product [Cylindrotheca closterium]|uniref:Bicarbonate transporter-like transmembrane domain-containing protein n=1 Tax=Cylindrotheca closterium TaxID=2856 RepID=A0AAD2FIE7_9STRA|nr:unnamed protein product [Cylindrotheca closterium]